MSNTIEDLRTELFNTLRSLTDKADPMEIERAKAVADIGQTIINSAKVEIDYLRVAGGAGTGFIPADGSQGAPQVTHTQTGTKTVIGGTTVHRMQG